MKNRIIVTLIIFISIVSCIDDVDNINLPRIEPKLVVQSFIEPNDSIKVIVWQSNPINYNLPIADIYSNNGMAGLREAIVTLRNSGDQIVEIPFVEELGMYVIPPTAYSIERGNTYHLKVSLPGYKEVRASTTVPDYVPILKEIKLNISNVEEWNTTRATLTGRIADEAKKINFYALFHYNLIQFSNWTDTINFQSLTKRELYNDRGYDGENIPFRIDYSLQNNDSLNFSLYVLSVDEHYYRFYQSLNNIEDISENPFAESNHLYSNVEGGLGVFASYVTKVINLDDLEE